MNYNNKFNIKKLKCIVMLFEYDRLRWNKVIWGSDMKRGGEFEK